MVSSTSGLFFRILAELSLSFLIKMVSTGCRNRRLSTKPVAGIVMLFTSAKLKEDYIIERLRFPQVTTFEILASGQCDFQCKIKETLLIRDFKPLLRKEQDEVILHVVTNIRDESSRSVAEGIINMVTQVQQDFPSTRLVISPMLPRSDNLELNDKVKEANKILKSFCSSRGLTLLHITNIDLTCLNRRGVHLNRKGSALLTDCYADFLMSH